MLDVQSNDPPSRLKRWRSIVTAPGVVVPIRLLVGGVFVFAGFSKLVLPHAEVVALIQQYTVIPRVFTPLIATCLPWLEVVSGTALLIGFYTTPAVLVVALQLVGFSVLMLVIVMTGVVLEDCGCFGNLGWHETPLQVLLRDVIMLLVLWPVYQRQRDVWCVVHDGYEGRHRADA